METFNNPHNFEASSDAEVALKAELLQTGDKLLDLLPDESPESLVVGRYHEILKDEDRWIFWAMFYHDWYKRAQQELRLHRESTDEAVRWLAPRYYSKVSYYYANMRDDLIGFRPLDCEDDSALIRYKQSLNDEQNKDLLKPEFSLKLEDLQKSLIDDIALRKQVCDETDKQLTAIKLLCSGYFKELSEEDMSYYANPLKSLSYVLENISNIAIVSGTR